MCQNLPMKGRNMTEYDKKDQEMNKKWDVLASVGFNARRYHIKTAKQTDISTWPHVALVNLAGCVWGV